MTVRQVRLKMLRVAFALVILATTSFAAEAATASWDRNTEPNIAGYKLSYGTKPGVHTKTIDVGNVTTCQFNPGPGVYYVVVQAYDTAGELSAKSSEVTINIAGTVTIDSFAPTGAGASIIPTVPASNSGAPAVSTQAVRTNTSAGATVTTLDDGSRVTFRIPFSDSGSADGTVVPPASQIVDTSGAVWTIGSGGAILRNGAWGGLGVGSKMLLSGGVIYALRSDNNWFKWLGSSWSNIGSTQPGTAATPPPAVTSANGTMVPPASQVTDATGSVWTIDGAQRILRNGVQASGGTGSKILWMSGSVYVLGSDGMKWWKWSGGWTNAGTILASYSGALAGTSVTSPIPASNSAAAEISAESLKTNVSGPAPALPASSQPTVNAEAIQPSLDDSDLPVLGDFDGDGRDDLATYRPSAGEWRIWTALSGFSAPIMAVWGMAGDLPMPEDYDGDRATDIAFYRPSTGSWHVWLSRTQRHFVQQWGDSEDRPVSLDHDGDGKADLALIRDGAYEILLSRTNYLTSVTVR